METKTSRIIRVFEGHSEPYNDIVAAEEPLEIVLRFMKQKKRIKRAITVTMRTPGDDVNLARGFLWSESIVEDLDDIAEVHCEKDAVVLTLDASVRISESKLSRNYISNSM